MGQSTKLEAHFGYELSDQRMLETISAAKIRTLLNLQGVAGLRPDQLQINEAR
jgi:hypothetical protein